MSHAAHKFLDRCANIFNNQYGDLLRELIPGSLTREEALAKLNAYVDAEIERIKREGSDAK